MVLGEGILDKEENKFIRQYPMMLQEALVSLSIGHSTDDPQLSLSK